MTLLAERTDDMCDVSADEVLASHFTLVDQPGSVDVIKLDGAEGWTSDNPHPVLSLMRWTTNDYDNAAAALDQMVMQFRENGRGFDWMTGPRCADAGLLPLLHEKGFISPPLDVAAMARHIKPHEQPEAPEGIRIWKVEDASDSRIWDVMGRGFDVSDDVSAVLHHAYMTTSDLQRTDIYAASVDGEEAPVGVGYLSYIGDGPSVLLRVSSTLQGHRGRGIYRALVQRRLHDAALQGRRRAFVHAYSGESRSCLEHLGFASVGSLQLHRWRP